jgi:hypothetical protein
MELEKLINQLGIELIEIDVTKYIEDTFFVVDFKNYPNGSFKFELKDSLNPAVPQNIINYEGTGILNNGSINLLNIEFYHDFTYKTLDTVAPTKMVYNIERIENLILSWI